MHRRNFLALGAAPALWAQAPQRAFPKEAVESLTPGPEPAVILNHLGFVPESKKLLIVRTSGESPPAQFSMREIGSVLEPFRIRRPLARVSSGGVAALAGDFSDVRREGMYQVSVNGERSVPFFIRPDVWRRTLPKAAGYHKYQRCGVRVPNVHAACHLDDARRRDNGEHVDLTGGWHDAGDLRKWMTATMMNAFGMLWLLRNLGEDWDLAGSGSAPVREEVRWGNVYFLKMQDKDGLVFADVAGGIHGDNSDNHWTDNRAGTKDDRYLNVSKTEVVQAMFAALQAMMAQEFARSDREYAGTCLQAALRCWSAAGKRGDSSLTAAWWTLAALELRRATRREEYGNAAVEYGSGLAALQNTQFTGNQKRIRGFWQTAKTDSNPYCEAVYSALPGIALLQLSTELSGHSDAARWRDAVRLHLDEYVLPMSALSCYGNVPYGVFFGSPTPEVYRPLAGDLTFRHFMPTRKQSWWLGMSSHLQCYAVLLASAAPAFRN
ncbi:MAG: glycoside hydrolase family 9 protein, partial [Bryobacteraceae bacterium]